MRSSAIPSVRSPLRGIEPVLTRGLDAIADVALLLYRLPDAMLAALLAEEEAALLDHPPAGVSAET